MHTLVLSVQLQTEFLEALEQKTIQRWCVVNKNLIETVSKKLKQIKISRDDPKLCKLICDSFSKYFKMLCDTEAKKKIPKKKWFENKSEKFERRLLKSYITKNWTKFKIEYKYFFDFVLKILRNQKVLDLRIEGHDNMEYSSFDDAENCRNGLSECPVDKKPGVDVSIGNRNRNSVTHQSFQLSDADRSSKSSCSNENVRRRKLNEHSNEPQQETYENQIKAVMATTQPSPIYDEHINSKKYPIVNRTNSNASINSHNIHFRRDAMDASFLKRLSAQNEKFTEDLQKIKAKRERLNREAEEEMRKLRIESAKRIQIFLKCINLKIKWEEQEKEWSDWLKCARDPVIKVKTQFMEFDGIKRYDDEDEIRSELLYFHKCVQVAYSKLVWDFENLECLSIKYDNKLFLRVIQKSISDVATKLCDLLEQLELFQNTKQFFETIHRMESEIDSMEIPTTLKLRQICKTASDNDYQFVNPPKQQKSSLIVEEIL